jgi:N-acetylglucosaminyl-diphospho-decaprenol L-rhamnosyltransferase
MLQPFKHVLLTRFNAKFAARWTELCLDPTWLEHRFSLFQRFCYPAVRSQSNTDFVWLVFFHDKTPSQYRLRIEQMAEWPVMQPVYNSFLSREVIVERIRSVVDSGTRYLITSTLDNDDSISRNYIEETQKQFAHQDYQYVNWAIGYVYRQGKYYFRTDPQSPFNSLIASVDKDTFVWDVWHNKIMETGAVIQVDKNPGWIQVIHGKNVSNRIRGSRIPRPDVTVHFGINLPVERVNEALFDLFADRWILCPLRSLRDFVARHMKRFVNLQQISYRLRLGNRNTR